MSKTFASQLALKGVTLDIRDGEFFSLLGPSGCGKTTLLRVIAGFECPDAGDLLWEGQSILKLKAQERPFHMVFQKYALFPHMDVFSNVEFGLRLRKIKAGDRSRRVLEVLHLVGLEDRKHQMPDTLSGGQAQRVALARAIVNEPKVLLLDEPLSALDQNLREHMQTELRQIQRRLGITFILVTHDQDEAMSLSDRIAVMNAGQLEQVATPQELYDNPSSHFVSRFIGSMGSLSGTLSGQDGSYQIVRTNKGQQVRGKGNCSTGQSCEAFVRPQRVFLGTNPQANEVEVKIINKSFKGSHYEYLLQVDQSQQLKAQWRVDHTAAELKVGQNILIHFLPQDTFIFSDKKDAEGLI